MQLSVGALRWAPEMAGAGSLNALRRAGRVEARVKLFSSGACVTVQ